MTVWPERKQEAGDENNMQETMMMMMMLVVVMMMMMMMLVVVVMMMMMTINRKFTFPVVHIRPLFPARGTSNVGKSHFYPVLNVRPSFRAAKGCIRSFKIKIVQQFLPFDLHVVRKGCI